MRVSALQEAAVARDDLVSLKAGDGDEAVRCEDDWVVGLGCISLSASICFHTTSRMFFIYLTRICQDKTIPQSSILLPIPSQPLRRT